MQPLLTDKRKLMLFFNELFRTSLDGIASRQIGNASKNLQQHLILRQCNEGYNKIDSQI